MNEEKLYAMRHSLAHVMAAAVQKLWPEAKFGVGPVVENGFYYDIDIPKVTISTDDFSRIEEAMREIIAEKQEFVRTEKLIDEAITWAKEHRQPYKEELLNDLKRSGTTVAKDLDANEMGTITEGEGAVSSVSFYQNGDFIDLCRGPHVHDTSEVGAFKLMRVAGAYWRGNEKNPQMQRLYGVAFATKEDLQQYLMQFEEAKKRDHRKLGQELDLFVLSDLVGSGLPLFTPRGVILRDQLGEFSQEIQLKYGYQKVMIPHMARAELYKVSGHYEKYPEKFTVTSEESDDEFLLKPMSCPHHIQIYASRPRSYKELPIRYMENTQVYRDEKSGELHGLSRVRMITQDDSHCFCTPDQVGEELSHIVEMVRDMYTALNMEYRAILSFRDESDKYLGEKSVWEEAQRALESTVKQHAIAYETVPGEAAFYGPKVDFMVRDAIGREWQCATLQLDFLQPQRFKLEYTGDDGEKHPPVMIHKALLGSIERFLSVYIEHTAGKFPIWLAPEQLRLIQVKDSPELDAYVNKIADYATEHKLRVSIDRSHDSVGKKIRQSELMKIPYVVVIGEKELADKVLTPRIRNDLAVSGRGEETYQYENLVRSIANEMKTRAHRSSL